MKSTTHNPLFYEYDEDFLYNLYDGPSEQWELEYEGNPLFDGYESYAFLEKVVDPLKMINFSISLLGILVTIPHLFISTRKELRANVIFIIMIGISLCDLLLFLSIALEYFNEKFPWSKTKKCETGFVYQSELLIWMTKSSKITLKPCSALLALSMAILRAITVKFPLTDWVQTLLVPRAGVVTVTSMMLGCLVWKSTFFMRYSIKKRKGCPSLGAVYFLDTGKTDRLYEDLYKTIDGYFTIILSLVYLFFTFALILELQKAKRKRKTLSSSSKSDNTLGLVTTMTVFFCISEVLNGVYYILDVYFWQEYLMFNIMVFSDIEYLMETLLVFNSMIHSFICYFMSSQYREIVKLWFWRKDRNEVAKIKSNSISVVETVSVIRMTTEFRPDTHCQ